MTVSPTQHVVSTQILRAAAARLAETRVLLRRSGIEAASEIADSLGPIVPAIESLQLHTGGAR
jgi:hypothetical protein